MNHRSKLFGSIRSAILLVIVIMGLVFLSSVIGCSEGGGGLPREAELPICEDNDGDGYFLQSGCGTLVDSDDTNPTIYPGAPEICADGVDNDSDGYIDEGCASGCKDLDADGFFDREGCVTPVDCDDLDETLYPGAPEACGDDVDNDCNGLIDEGCAQETCGDDFDNDGDMFIDEECEPGFSSVPDTGQTICYDKTDRLFPCPVTGQAFYGQDGCYPFEDSPYTKLDRNGADLPDDALNWTTVRDNVTGLIWEVKVDDGGPQDKDFKYTWNSLGGSGFGNSAYIATLNGSLFGGFSDWRVPTINELSDLVNFGTYGPAINLYFFPNTMFSTYWSITQTDRDEDLIQGGEDLAWSMDFYDGTPDALEKDKPFYVRAVRGPRSGPHSYTDNGNKTITDNTTGLMWMKEPVPEGLMGWKSALLYCETISFSGYTDWRLPNIKELRSLVDYERVTPAINTDYFSCPKTAGHWSSTTVHHDRKKAWVVGFFSGGGGGTGKSNTNYVRAVRDAIADNQNP